MYKNIVPGLISFDTQLNKLPCFTFSEQFNFYPLIKTPNKFHYKVEIDNHIQLPSVYDFRNRYLLYLKNCWFYNWQLSHNFYLRFKFNTLTNTFSFNNLYNHVPFELGRILPIGRHLTNILSLHLFLKNYISFKGAAVKTKNETIGIITPSYNGKSTLIREIINKDKNKYRYITEDNLILNLKNRTTYPLSPSISYKNFMLKKILDPGRYKEDYTFNDSCYKNKVSQPQKIDKLFLTINNTSDFAQTGNYSLLDFFLISSPNLFFDSVLVRSMIFKYQLLNKVKQVLNNINSTNINYRFISVNNFNYDRLFK